MLRLSGKLLSRIITGMVVFAGAGFLIAQILTDNGGNRMDQAFWDGAREKAVPLADPGPKSTGYQRAEEISDILTGSIKPLADPLPEQTKPEKRIKEEPSVLSLIRENRDIAPAVSAGTDRVSVIVKPGDTLFGIARRHGLKLSEIAQLNGLEEPYVIKTGQTLYVAR